MDQQARAKIKQFGGWVFNVLPMCLALVALLWTIFAAVIWPIENARNLRAAFNLENGCILEVWGPAIIPLETPVDLYFALRQHQQNVSCEPVTLQVEIPEDLVILSPSPNPLARQVVLVFNGSNPKRTQTIQVANAKQRSGLVTASLSIKLNQKQDKEMGQEQSEEIGTIDIQVEQTWRGVLRKAGGGGDSIPLGPLITVITSVWTLLNQYLQAAKEKEKERAQQANERMGKMQQALKERNLETTEKNLMQIEQQGLEAYLEAGDLTLVRRLIQLAKGSISPLSFEGLSQEWLEVAAGAILYAARYNLTDRQGLEELMRSFPADKLKDTSLKEEWMAVSNNIGVEIPSQAREWPRPTLRQWPAFVSPPGAGIEYNPFSHDRAEKEEAYLFAHPKGLFWSDHPTFQRLNERRSAWIVGEPGSGKTALALAIGKYLLSNDVFAEKGFGYYFRYLPTVTEIRHALTGRLLDAILQAPSYLPSGEEQHCLLAEVLLTALSAGLILGRIEQTVLNSNWSWLEKTQDKTQRAIWRAEACSRLRLLAESVRKCNPLSQDALWPGAWSTAIHFLGFEICTRLAFDLDAPPLLKQESDTLDTLARWTEYGIHTLVFSLPDKRLGQALAGWTSHLDLTWNETDMGKMAKWRWEQVYPERKFETLFENSDAEIFFFQRAQGNPARLIRLWNRLFTDQIQLPLSQKQIESAARDLVYK